MTKTCGIDWSEAQHDVAIVDDQARVVARARVTDDAAGFGAQERPLGRPVVVQRLSDAPGRRGGAGVERALDEVFRGA
ncbi:MAG: hypothetical protein ACJ72I_03375, partial [Pseudonocardiaceae bacterium]